jgi:hypothetical protein
MKPSVFLFLTCSILFFSCSDLKKDEQLKVSEELTNSLHKELKGQRTKTFLWKVGTYAGIIASTYLILTK